MKTKKSPIVKSLVKPLSMGTIIIIITLFTLFIVAKEIKDDPKICNKNNICEVEIGEKFLNCPTDCGIKKFFFQKPQFIIEKDECYNWTKCENFLDENTCIENYSTSCERVEVDEARRYIKGQICEMLQNGSYGNCKENNSGYITEFSKSDLSLEWLEENCECIEKVCNKKDHQVMDNLCIREKDGYRYEPTICQEFKCGEYFVRIK